MSYVPDPRYVAQLQANYAHNVRYAKDGPYETVLTPAQEVQFERWVHENHVNFDLRSPLHAYDMRGYWLALQHGAAQAPQMNQIARSLHYPDTFKTPYDRDFSNQSRYAKPNAPQWVADGRYLVDAEGNIIFDQATQNEDSPWDAVPRKYEAPVRSR